MGIETRQEQIIQEIVKRFENVLSGFIDNNQDRESEINHPYFKHLLTKAASNYAKSYARAHGFMQIFGSRHLSAIASIYIPQRFQAITAIRNFESVDELEEAFSQDLQRSSHNKGNNLLGINIANEESYLMVLGHPANGKTTFLKYIAWEALRFPHSPYKHDLLPIFISMWKFCHSDDTLSTAIAEELERLGFPSSKEITQWLLSQGKLLILIDGLNESTLSQKYISQHLQHFVKTYPLNRYIISSRLISYQNSLGQFLEVGLQPWSDLLIQEYIHKWFAIKIDREDEDIPSDHASAEAQRCWEILQRNQIARDLANSPLCLSLLCLLCDRRYSFPSHVSGLYQQAIYLMIEEQVLKCQLLNQPNRNIINTDILEIFLTEIAYTSFELNQTVLNLEQVMERLRITLSNCKSNLQNLDIQFALRVLQQAGVCQIRNAKDSPTGLSSLVFSHITFQEYFVARYIYHHQKTAQIVPMHLGDRRWQQVFLMLAGMMLGNSETLLLAIEAQAASYINTARLRNILDWVDHASIHASSKAKGVIKRIATLFIARPRFTAELSTALILTRMLSVANELHKSLDGQIEFDQIFAVDLSLSLANALDFDSITELNLVVQLCQYLEHSLAPLSFDYHYVDFAKLNQNLQSLSSQTPSYDQPYEVRAMFRDQISKVWLKSLYLPAELNQISYQEVESLESYLYANLLMVQCKNMVIAVSTKIWQEIESRMLRI
ncbi:MAG: hypothetical protein AUK48_07865 [Oscillatoriales cyanobacterium CG2_30_44_21]|nr:MAG: hypothetical protein AUK48_07865 [Oscillatoriales cyanobacterium CG2_30_44_21]